MVKLLLILMVFLNFYALGTSRMRAFIQVCGMQGLLLGMLTFSIHDHFVWRHAAVALLTLVIKGIIIPAMLFRAIREVRIRREVEPILGFVPSLLLGGIGTALSMIYAERLPLVNPLSDTLVVATSFSTILTGFILIVTRQKAISQVVGYLILENGIFVFGLLLMQSTPFLVELGVLLDVFVGVFIMGIIINYIQRTFSSIDTTHLETLKE
ncbi:MAG: hydrogenase [Candidatus Hydrogenedentes bacterium]|nr:hydrogenase [Candidatus Hydrogenedentota bacterium]